MGSKPQREDNVGRPSADMIIQGRRKNLPLVNKEELIQLTFVPGSRILVTLTILESILSRNPRVVTHIRSAQPTFPTSKNNGDIALESQGSTMRGSRIQCVQLVCFPRTMCATCCRHRNSGVLIFVYRF